jgi:hypothetical protein
MKRKPTRPPKSRAKRPEDRQKPGPKPWTPNRVDLKKAREYAEAGATFPDIARVLGISEDTLGRRRKESAELAEAIKDGSAARNVSDALKVEDYIKHKYGAKLGLTALIFRLKTRGGWREKVEVAGDPDAPVKVATTLKFTPAERAEIARIIGQAVKK